MNPFEKILERLDEMIHPKQLYFCKYARGVCKHSYNDKDCMDCVVELAKEIVQEVAREYNNGWISCSDRLPEYDEEYIKKYNNDKQYIVICKYSYAPTVAHFSKEKIWYYDDFVKFNDVIAWQPLPEPYQQNGE